MNKSLFIIILFSILPVVALSQNRAFTGNDLHVEKYTERVVGKMQIYENRIRVKTEKTLQKLCHWENKIRAILIKVNPDAENRMFAGNTMTFGSLLEKIKKGEEIANGFQLSYDGYLDTLSTTLRYLKQENALVNNMVDHAVDKAIAMEQTISRTEYISAFIKERKKQLLNEAKNYISHKLISKASKEEYYYIASLKNYKELFSDQSKTEELVKKVLSEVPAFKDYIRKNSMLASLFRLPETGGGSTTVLNLAGLQTRAGVQDIIQQRIASGGPNAQAQVQQNLAAAQVEMNRLKDKINQFSGNANDQEMPDFKPNEQKSKTLWQRLEYGFDVQFAKNNAWMPSAGDIAGSLGYKISDKSVVGIGMSYKLGIGNFEHIRFTSEGIGLRSYLDWKAPFSSKWGILSNLWISGGYEMNYNSDFKKIEQLKGLNLWQRSALIGISKKYKISKKMKGEMKLLYDFMAQKHVPVSQPLIFRLGYKL